MRAISPISNYGIQLIEAPTRRGPDSTGTIVEWQDGKPWHAQFHQGGLTEWEQLVALESFDFSGLPEGVNPLTRVSMYDTEAAVSHLADETDRANMQTAIEKRLKHLQTLYPSEFIIVAKPAAPRPWPTYDETPLEDVLDENNKISSPGIRTMQKLTGISPEAIRLYEDENRQDADVIALCEALEREALGEDAPMVEEKISVGV